MMMFKVKSILIYCVINILFVPFSVADVPNLPSNNQKARVLFEQAVKHYTKDCHAKFSVVAYKEDGEIKLEECSAYDTDQNCNFDYFSCFEKQEKCKVDCTRPCTGCQTDCANSCDDCKSKCGKNDLNCLVQCAKKRASCRSSCLTSLDQCRDVTCNASLQSCHYDGLTRMKDCDFSNCEAYQECLSNSSVKNHEKVCQTLMPQDSFCTELCFEVPKKIYFFDENISINEFYSPLVKACTPASNCPSDYQKILPFLDGFCGGILTKETLKKLPELVAKKEISKDSINLIFNAYGAFYGYQFKKKKWMNRFFYGSGEWLPKTCKSRIKSVTHAQYMPLSMTQLRDQIKRIWKQVK